jgi:hypothetical protein
MLRQHLVVPILVAISVPRLAAACGSDEVRESDVAYATGDQTNDDDAQTSFFDVDADGASSPAFIAGGREWSSCAEFCRAKNPDAVRILRCSLPHRRSTLDTISGAHDVVVSCDSMNVVHTSGNPSGCPG